MVYKISFEIKTPIITSTDIHLDSIFYCVSPASHNKDVYISRFSTSLPPELPIPIDCVKIDDKYIYCCSTADYINAEQITENFTKRRDYVDYHYLNNIQTPRKGIERDIMAKAYGVVCTAVEFKLSSSNFADVNRYCRRIHSIGGLRKEGYGEVTSYSIEELDEPWQSCIIENGKAIRNIPQIFLKNDCTNKACCKSPYWMNNFAELCAITGDQAELKNEVFLSAYKRN